MNEKILKDPTVQLLKSVGFSDDYILKGIESGEIILKSEDAAGAHESETKQEDDINKLEKEEKVKEDEKETAEKIQKSIGDSFAKSINPLFESLQKSIEGLREDVKALKEQTPSFRSEGLVNLSAIQKSMSFEKDEEGKTEINIVTQRSIASQAISKALDGIKDDEIKKSLESDALAFLMNPEAETVGENLARYMYGKGVKFVK